MAKKVISMELGTWWTKVVYMDYGKKSPQIHDMFSFRTPEHAVEDGYIRDKESFTKALKDELAKRQISEKSIFFNINSPKVITREVSLPLLKDKQLEGVIQTQAKEYFPMDVSGCSISYRKMHEAYSDEGVSMRILLIAIPDNLIANYINFAESTGFDIEGFDYIGNSIASFANAYFRQNCVVVQLEENETIISVFAAGKLVFQRVAPNGYSMALSAVMDHEILGVDEEYGAFDFLMSNDMFHREPEDCEPGTEAARREDAYADITDVLHYQTRVVFTALDYYKTQSKQDLYGSFYLIGSGADIAGIEQIFREEISIEYEDVSYRSILRFSKRLSAKEVSAVDFVTAIGATLQPLSIKSKEMREEESEKKTRKSTGLIFTAAIVVSIALIVVGVMRYFMAVTERDKLQRKVKELAYVEEVFNEHELVKAEEEQYAGFDSLTAADNERMPELIAQLEEKLPARVTVQSMSVTGKSITLNMASPDKVTAAQLLLNLKEIPFLGDISLPAVVSGVDASGSRIWQFSLTASYKEEEEETPDETGEAAGDAAADGTETEEEAGTAEEPEGTEAVGGTE